VKTLQEKRVSVGRGKHQVVLTAIITVDGLIISLLGGDRPHVGAMAVGIPRLSLKDPSKTSATTSVFTLVGHKDDEVARPAAERIAKILNQTVIVVAGIHIDQAEDEDIERIANNSKKAVEVFLRKIKNSTGDSSL
jgi:hypothetical protein